jgi:hypothetical protein
MRRFWKVEWEVCTVGVMQTSRRCGESEICLLWSFKLSDRARIRMLPADLIAKAVVYSRTQYIRGWILVGLKGDHASIVDDEPPEDAKIALLIHLA